MEFIEIESGIGSTQKTPKINTPKQQQKISFSCDIDNSYRSKRYKNKILITRWCISSIYSDNATFEIFTDKDYELIGEFKIDEQTLKNIITSSRNKFDNYLHGVILQENIRFQHSIRPLSDDYIFQLLHQLIQCLSRLRQ